jgi:hypothetical protein
LYQVGKDICLSATAYHQETWDPTWNLRTLVMALRGHMLSYPKEIGAILTSVERQKTLAKFSRNWMCKICGVHHSSLSESTSKHSMDDISNFSGHPIQTNSNKKNPIFARSIMKKSMEASSKKARIKNNINLIEKNNDKKGIISKFLTPNFITGLFFFFTGFLIQLWSMQASYRNRSGGTI